MTELKLCLAAVPSQERLRRDQGGQFVKHPAAQFPGLDRQTTALVVVQAQPSSAELFPKNSVFFLQVADDILLRLVQSACGGAQKRPKGIKCQAHYAMRTPQELDRRAGNLRRTTAVTDSVFRESGFSDPTRSGLPREICCRSQIRE